MHFRLHFIIEANVIHPDQTAPVEAVSSRLLLVAFYAILNISRKESRQQSHDWRKKFYRQVMLNLSSDFNRMFNEGVYCLLQNSM